MLFSEHEIDMIVPELRESLDIDLVGIEYDYGFFAKYPEFSLSFTSRIAPYPAFFIAE